MPSEKVVMSMTPTQQPTSTAMKKRPMMKAGKCPEGIQDLISSFNIPTMNASYLSQLQQQDGLLLVQVINGTVHLQDAPAKEEMVFERDRREAFLQMLTDSLPSLESRDFSLLVSSKDCCGAAGPIFSVTRCHGTGQLPYVQWNRIRDGPFIGWNRRQRRARDRVRQIQWDAKKATAVFRGSVARRWSYSPNGIERSTLLNDDNWRQVGRTILADLANSTAPESLLDVQLRFVRDKVPSFPFREAEQEMSMEEQATHFRYTAIVEGNCGWADRFKSFLSMGTLCMVQETSCREFYGWLARPGIEYLSVAGNLQNLTETIRWARANNVAARGIAEAGMRFADQYLTEASMQCYMRALFREYQRHWEEV